MNDTKNAIYVYCFARSDAPLRLDTKAIDAQGKISTLSVDQVTAILCETSTSTFVGPEAEARMANIEWIGPWANRHQETIQRVMANSPVLPLRFGTLFTNRNSLKQRIQHHHETITTFLNQVEGRAEWSIKIFFDRKALFNKILKDNFSPHIEHLANLSPGRRYIEERRIHRETEAEVWNGLSDRLAHMDQAIKPYIDDLKERKNLPQNPEETSMEMVANWAVLLTKIAQEPLQKSLTNLQEELASDGFSIALSGPWPPFSFSPVLDEASDP